MKVAVVYKNVITEDERVLLREHALNLLDNGILDVNKATAGTYRNFKSFFDVESLPEFHQNLYYRIVSLLEFKEPEIDPALGIIISVIKPGGYIHNHQDVYEKFPHTKHLTNKRNVRFNVMVDRGEDLSYNPVIDNKTFIVNKCDAWCFVASEITHRTEKIAGPENRIVYQFGFCLDAI